MEKYTVRYLNREWNPISVTRKAESAWDAAEKVARQFGWGIEFNMIDADTRGQVWGSGFFKVWNPADVTDYDVRTYISERCRDGSN